MLLQSCSKNRRARLFFNSALQSSSTESKIAFLGPHSIHWIQRPRPVRSAKFFYQFLSFGCAFGWVQPLPRVRLRSLAMRYSQAPQASSRAEGPKMEYPYRGKILALFGQCFTQNESQPGCLCAFPQIPNDLSPSAIGLSLAQAMYQRTKSTPPYDRAKPDRRAQGGRAAWSPPQWNFGAPHVSVDSVIWRIVSAANSWFSLTRRCADSACSLPSRQNSSQQLRFPHEAAF